MRRSPPWRFVVASAAGLAALLCFSILTDAARERWAISVLQAGTFTLGAAWALRMVFRPYRLRGSLLLLPLGGTVLWGLVQLGFGQTAYRFETWEAALRWGTNFVLFLLSLQIFHSVDMRRAFRRAMVWFGFTLGVVSVLQFFTSTGKILWLFPARYAQRAVGPFVNGDHYASFVALVLPAALYGGMSERRNSGACAAMAGALFASVIAVGSRGGSILVTLEAAVLFLAWAVPGARPCRMPVSKLIRILCFAILFTSVVGGEVLWKRFQDPDPYGGRREMFHSSLAMLRDRPWIGFGLGTWPAVYPAYALFDRGVAANHAHCDWAEWAAEGGILFAGMMLWVFAGSVRAAIRHPWGGGVVAVMLHSLVDFPLQKPSLAALVFVILGATASAPRQNPETE